MGSPQRPEAAFILSLLGGALILAGGANSAVWAVQGMPSMSAPMARMMGGHGEMMEGMRFPAMGFLSGMSSLGLVAGVLVLVGAVMLYSQHQETVAWGVIILVFSVLSLFGMGGFLAGAVLGIVGGALALGWRPGQS